MDDLINQLAYYVELLAKEWDGFQHWSPSGNAFSLISLVCAGAAVMMSRIIGSSGIVTIPAAYVLFFFSSMLSNYFGRNLYFSGQSEVVRTVMFCMPGICISVVILLMIFKTREAAVEGRG